MHWSHHVSHEDAGKRLDRTIAEHIDGVSRMQAQRMIDAGWVLVNGLMRRKRHTVQDGDRIEVETNESIACETAQPQAESIPLRILFEDDELVAIDKPPGLVVHPGSGNRAGTLVNALLHHVGNLSTEFGGERPGIVHRLDKDTSGVVLAAKTNRAHASLAAQFAERTVVKYYIGVCIGPRPVEHDIIEAPVGRSRTDPTRFVVTRRGKPATTEYWLLGYREGVAALRFRLHTGRTHQIRVHMASRGLPIAGDAVYGGDRGAVRKLEPLERPFAYSILKGFGRQALHAHSIRFRHPVTAAAVEVIASVPDDIAQALGNIGVSGGVAD